MRPRAAFAALSVLLLLVFGAQAATQRVHQPPPEPDVLPIGYQPAPNSDEAGLWMMGDQAERGFKASPLLVRDPALNAYVHGVVCRLAPDRCDSIRVYILDIPYFNAAMFPNGAMQVWTGLLLRAHNEAQLAFILGHEISHYTHRHTIDQWRRLRNTTGFLAFFNIATAGFTAGVAGLAATLAAMGSLMSYSRDEEREADAAGFDMAVAAGYDPAEASLLWQGEAAEEKADPLTDKDFAFLRTHPESTDRMDAMHDRTAKATPPAAGWVLGADPYHAAIAPFRAAWFAEDLSLGKFERSLCLLNRLSEEEPGSGLLRFYTAEVYRRRNAAGDAALAVSAYHEAIDLGPAKGTPAAAWKGLGLVSMKSGDTAAAREAFTQYLAAAPDADDRSMVDLYLTRMQEQSQ